MSTNPQASGLPGVNMATAAFGKATLPTLGSRVDLAHHIHIVDNCLLECGLATLDTEGKVCIKPQSKYVAMSRILTSLSTVKEVAASAQRAATRFDYDWVSVKRLLTRQYCKKETLKAEYSSQLTKLRLISESDDPEPFIEKATECFALCQRAFDDDRSERRAFIRALCNRLPHDCVLSILRSVQSALLAKGLSDGDTEWETSIAFDDFDLAAREEADAPPVTAITFCSALRSSCGLAREARLLTSSPQVKTDAIKAIREAGDHPQRRPKFSEKFPFVVYVSGSLVDDRDKFPKYIATVKPTDSLRTKNKRGKPYALLGFATEEAGSSALADLQADRGSGLVVRQFQTDPPKNGPGPPQPASSSVSSSSSISVETTQKATLPGYEPTISQLITGAHSREDSLHWVPNRSPALSELTLKIRIGESDVNRALVDSGAGFSYLIARDPGSLAGLEGHASPRPVLQSVRLADGSLYHVNTIYDVSLRVYDVNAHPVIDTVVPLRLLVAPAARPQILIGRDLIERWGLCIKGATQIVSRCGEVLYQRPCDEKQFATLSHAPVLANVSEDDRQDPSAPQTLAGYQPDPNGQEFIPVIEDELRDDLDAWLLDLVEVGVRQFGPGVEGPYRMQLLPMAAGDTRDTPLQKFYFRFSLPPPSSASPARRIYARQLYDKLSEEAKVKYRQLIDDYVQRHWWHPIDKSGPLPSDLAPAEIFLLGGRSEDKRKPRLVADFQPCNLQLPPSSTSGIAIDDVLLVIRALSPASLFSFDAASAFYRVRLNTNRPVLLHTGLAEGSQPDYYSDRTAFGISSGPQAMEASLGWLIHKFGSSPFAALLILLAIFVDDGIAGSSDRKIVRVALSLLYALSVCGFGCSLLKMQFITAYADLVQNGFIEPSAVLLHLGCSLSYIGHSLRACCQNEARLADVLSLCKAWQAAGKRARLDKRAVFKLGGQISVDPLHLHGTCRLIGDCFRRLIGRACSSIGWNEPIDFEAFTEPLYAAWSELLQWCQDECELEKQRCVHDIPYELGAVESINLSVFTDASQSGGGYVIFKKGTDGDLYAIANAAFGWRQHQTVWHSNRRELCVLLRALRALVELCSNIKAMCPNPTLKISVDIGCDNKASVAWVNDTDFSLREHRSKSSIAVEKRVIQRLVLAVAEEFRALRKLQPSVTYKVYHCPGVMNEIADSLSRALDRPCGGSGPLLSTILASVPGIDFSGPQLIDHAVAQAERPSSDDVFVIHSIEEEVQDSLFLPCPSLDFTTINDSCDHLLRISLYHPIMAEADTTTAALDALRVFDELEEAGSDSVDTVTLVKEDADEGFLLDRLLEFNSVKAIYRMVAVLRGILVFWNTYCASKKRYPLRQTAQRLARNGSRAPPQLLVPACLPVGLQSSGYDVTDVLTVIRLSQQLDDFTKKGRAFVYDEPTGLWYFRSGTITGSTLRRPSVPRTAKRFRFLLALDAHARAGHGGATPTATFMQEDVHVIGATTAAKDVCRRCLPCAKLRLRMTALRWNAPLAGSHWDIDELLRNGNPYSVVCIDFLHLFPGELVFATRCITTSHVSWFRSSYSEECAAAAVEGVKDLMSRWGKIRVAYLDRGSAFTSSEFADTLREEGIELRYHAARAPWETPVERSHAVGLRMLRLNYTPQQLARSSDQDMNRIYDHVSLLMNSIPICVHSAGPDDQDVITADRLALGYTRSTGILLPMIESESVANVHIDRPRAVDSIRRTFLQHHWQLLRDRCAKAMGKKRGVDTPPLAPDTTVLVRVAQRNKLDVGVRIGHIVDVINPSRDGYVRRYKVRFLSGTLSEESHVNVIPASVHSAEHCLLGRGAC